MDTVLDLVTVVRDHGKQKTYFGSFGGGGNFALYVRPDRLTLTYQRWADQGSALDIRALNVGVDYWVAVEAFDENGVSRRTKAVKIR